LADRFHHLTERGLLEIDDSLLAAHHFVGMLLWIPVNRAMFTGNHDSTTAGLESYAGSAVQAFLRAYGAAPLDVTTQSRNRKTSANRSVRAARSAREVAGERG
jgi:hypothetical protein